MPFPPAKLTGITWKQSEPGTKGGGTIKMRPGRWTAPSIAKNALATDVEAASQANNALVL